MNQVLRSIANDLQLLEIGRKAVEDELIELRDLRVSTPTVGNGFVVKEKDGSPSDVIRLPTHVGLKIALEAIADYLLKESGDNMKFSEQTITVPNADNDVHIQMPDGKVLTIQFRPSNADTNYNGSLDIILPKNAAVTSWKGDDMEDAPAISDEHPHIRLSKQLCTELPWNTDETSTVLWMRLGDSGDYESFESLDSVAESLRESNVSGVEKTQGGIEAPGYQRQNYISLYWGPANAADLLRELNDDEFDDLQNMLCYSGNITFVEDCELVIIDSYDEENDVTDEHNEVFKSGDVAEVDFLRHSNETSDFQFPDGSVAFQVPNRLFKLTPVEN